MTAACIPHIMSPHPVPGRLLVEEVEGSTEGGRGVNCPPTLKIVSVLCACVSLRVSEQSVMSVCAHVYGLTVCECVCEKAQVRFSLHSSIRTNTISNASLKHLPFFGQSMITITRRGRPTETMHTED